MLDNAKKQDLVLTRVFDAPVGRVWDAWTKPNMVKLWWGPDNFECPTATIDLREGGTSLVSMVSPKLGFPEQFNAWRYTKIVPMERMEYISTCCDQHGNDIDPRSIGMPDEFPRQVLHIVTFEKRGADKTKVTVTEKDWPVGRMREMSKIGMEQCLDKMATALQ